jgi:hypothetical protein
MYGVMLITVCITAKSQGTRTDIKPIYEEAERLYNAGNYNLSLEYLKREGGTMQNSRDSLLFLKIMNLENLYRSDFQKTTDLEATFKLFFARTNKFSFPDIKYSAFRILKKEIKCFMILLPM